MPCAPAQYDRAVYRELTGLIPLPTEEIRRIAGMVREKVVMTFKRSAVVAAVHFVATSFAFWCVGSEVVWVFAFLSAVLSILPVLSSWVVWFPAAIILVAKNGPLSTSWMVMVGVHVFAMLLDYMSYTMSGIDQEQPELIGLSLVLGIYAFGPYGVLFGPLVTSLMLSLIELYKVYVPEGMRGHARRHSSSSASSSSSSHHHHHHHAPLHLRSITSVLHMPSATASAPSTAPASAASMANVASQPAAATSAPATTQLGAAIVATPAVAPAPVTAPAPPAATASSATLTSSSAASSTTPTPRKKTPAGGSERKSRSRA